MGITVNGARKQHPARALSPAVNQAKECKGAKARKSFANWTLHRASKIKFYQAVRWTGGRNIHSRLCKKSSWANEEAEGSPYTHPNHTGHNDQCRELVGKDYALITVRRYESCKTLSAELIKLKYKEDLPLSESQWGTGTCFWILSQNGEGVPAKYGYPLYMKCLEEDNHLTACHNEWINQRPVYRHQVSWERGYPWVPNNGWAAHGYNKEFPLDRIMVVRDVFYLVAFTGLAFIDVQQLSAEHIVQDNNGKLLICKPRQRRRMKFFVRYSDADFEKNHPGLPKENVLPCPLQSENEQLSERKPTVQWHIKDLDHAHSPPLVCDLCVPRQWWVLRM